MAWIGGAGLLAAAVISVGLFGDQADEQRKSTPAQGGQSVTRSSQLIRPVAASETEAAIGRLMMAEPEKAKVRAEVARGAMRLGWITVSDIRAEDGDWVRLAAGGFRQDVRLLHKPYTMAVPYLPGTPVSVTGLVDGGGGEITVAVYVGAAQVSLRPLKKGEVLQIPAP
ncbi:MAG: hypothetical protein KDJ37_09475 [Hyphomicrobiaceae bacterium]|nr:hypothetical protein [Hyphomicrobiaceae bacterium]